MPAATLGETSVERENRKREVADPDVIMCPPRQDCFGEAKKRKLLMVGAIGFETT